MMRAGVLLVRVLIVASSLAGIYLGIVLLYAFAQESAAEAEITPDLVFSSQRSQKLADASGHWHSAAGAWAMAGFSGRAAEARARGDILIEPVTAAQRDAQVAAVKAVLALRPTASALWFELGRLEFMEPVRLTEALDALGMMQLTAPRESALSFVRIILVLRNWTGILAAASEKQASTLREFVTQDLVANARTYDATQQSLLRATAQFLPVADQIMLRDALLSRLGKAIADQLIPPPPPPAVTPAPAAAAPPPPPTAAPPPPPSPAAGAAKRR